MIRINLSTAKRPIDLQNVGGINFSKINVKMVVIAMLCLYIPDILITGELESSRQEAEGRLSELTSQKNKLTKQVSGLREVDKQIQLLKRREVELGEKLEVVKSIITKKKNPWNILVYVARNIPQEIWLTELNFTANGNKIVFKGLSQDYTNQGIFLENLKRSVFFDKNISYNKTSSSVAAPNSDVKNLAPFEITATVTRFE